MARAHIMAATLLVALAAPGCTDPPQAPPADAGTADMSLPAAPSPCLGYMVFSTPTSTDQTPLTRMVDMAGREVHSWPFSGFPSVMLPGGSLLTSRRMRDVDLNLLQDTVELIQVSWEGAEQWSFSAWDDDGGREMMSRQHHDHQRQGNPVGYHAPGQLALQSGTTTVLAHETRAVPSVSPFHLTDDVIYTVDRAGAMVGKVWRAADHVAEFGFDKTAREDIRKDPNYDDARGTGDWLHINSMSLLGRNRWFDQYGDTRFHPRNIIIASRRASFLAIISADTGAVVWRLGPDLSPGMVGAGVGQLVGPHHAHMVPQGLPGAGNILVFDNGGRAGYGGATGYPRYERWHSRVVEIDPRDMQKVWEYGPTVGTDMLFSAALGSAQRLPSGNTFITSGLEGRLLEVTPTGDVVWRLQIKDGSAMAAIYRAYRVPPEWLPAKANIAGYSPWSLTCRAN